MKNNDCFESWTDDGRFRSFFKGSRQVATISKKWTGLFTEIFTDKDTFQISFDDGTLTEPERKVVLAASVFIELQYFERKSGA